MHESILRELDVQNLHAPAPRAPRPRLDAAAVGTAVAQEEKGREFPPSFLQQEIDMPTHRNQNQGQDRRGFASMDPDKQRSIAAEGGRAAHRSGNAHQFDSREARAAGRKGGESVSQDRGHMSDIGRKGGGARGGGGSRNER